MSKQIAILLLWMVSLISCDSRVMIMDSDGDTVEFEIKEVKITSNRIEKKKEDAIKKNITEFLKANRDTIAIIKNYWFLCDTNRIKILREYDVGHKDKNITIGLHKTKAEVTPIPSVYKISEGAFGEYKIEDPEFGRLYSYQIIFSLTKNQNIADYYAIIQFARPDSNGLDRVTYKRRINKTEDYYIEDNV